MGETRVDLHRLLEDLRDAYPGSVEETILTEIVANSLDSGARRIVFRADPGERHADRYRRWIRNAAPRSRSLP